MKILSATATVVSGATIYAIGRANIDTEIQLVWGVLGLFVVALGLVGWLFCLGDKVGAFGRQLGQRGIAGGLLLLFAGLSCLCVVRVITNLIDRDIVFVVGMLLTYTGALVDVVFLFLYGRNLSR
jgi:hypothetical protein